MEDMPTYEDRKQGEELLPSLAFVHKLYDDDMLQQFVDAAGILLDDDVQLTRFDTIQLLILLANSVEDPEDMRDDHDLAQAEYRMAQLYYQVSSDEFRAVHDLCAMLDRILAVVETVRAEADGTVEAEVMGEEAVKDSKSSADGADDRDDGEDSSNAMGTGTVAVALRVRTALTPVPHCTC